MPVLMPTREAEAPVGLEWDLDWRPPVHGNEWVVILYNCNCHSFEEVIQQLMLSTGCDPGKAASIAMEAHISGRAVAYDGDVTRCEAVAKVLGATGLQVEAAPS